MRPGCEHLDAVLGIVAGFDVVAERARAGLRLEHAGQNLQQGGFARAIRADEHDALAALGLEIHAAIDHVFAVGMVDVLQRDDPQAAALRLGKLEIELAIFASRRVDLLHALDLLELALGLGGFGVLGPEPVDEFHQPGDFALLVFVGGKELLLGRLRAVRGNRRSCRGSG